MWLSGGHLPREGRGCSSWKMASFVLRRPTVLYYFCCCFYQKKKSCLSPFKMGSIVLGIFIRLRMSALPLQRQDVTYVMSVQGFIVFYWSFFTGPVREWIRSMNWQTHICVSSPECISFPLIFIPLYSLGVAVSPKHVLVAHSYLTVLWKSLVLTMTLKKKHNLLHNVVHLLSLCVYNV